MANKVKKIEKPWGYEELIEQNDHYVVKKLFMKDGHRCSLQYHNQKTETIMVLQGALGILLEGQEFFLNPFESITIKPLQKHRMFAKGMDCLYMESSTTELDDVVRISDDYKR